MSRQIRYTTDNVTSQLLIVFFSWRDVKSVLPDSIVSISMFCDLFIEAHFDFSPSPPQFFRTLLLRRLRLHLSTVTCRSRYVRVLGVFGHQ